MTKPRIEEIKAEFQMFVPEDDGSAMDWLENILAETKNAGIDEAVGIVEKEQVLNYGRAEWVSKDNLLQALQDNK